MTIHFDVHHTLPPFSFRPECLVRVTDRLRPTLLSKYLFIYMIYEHSSTHHISLYHHILLPRFECPSYRLVLRFLTVHSLDLSHPMRQLPSYRPGTAGYHLLVVNSTAMAFITRGPRNSYQVRLQSHYYLKHYIS